MNKLIYTIAMFMALQSCTGPSRARADGALATDSVTLNGFTFAQADKMIREFRANRQSSKTHTSVWLSKGFIDNLAKILPGERVDGFRIYFAKDKGINSILMVATQRVPNPDSPGRFMNKDYFELKSPFFRASLGINKGEVETDKPLTGIASASAAECTDAICTKSPNGIKCDQGKRWVNQFLQEPINNRSLWYPDSLIYYWKQELDAAVKEGKKGDGIRIYFAKNDAGKHVFVAVTTREKDQPRSDYFECFSDKMKSIDVDDNGDECPISCTGATWEDLP